jgi:hypothetical protein
LVQARFITDVGEVDRYRASHSNRFAKNTYYLSGTAMYFNWYGGPRTDSQWRSYGQDTGGSFNR